MTSRTHRASFALAAVALVAMSAGPSAQRGGRGGGPQAAPVATNTILQNPDAYFGKPVTISAGVEEVLSKTAFVIDQRKVVGANEVKGIGKPILVIAPYLNGPLDQKTYLLMTGQIVKLDAAAVAKVVSDYKIAVAPEISAKYMGQPVLVATSVLTSRSVEIGRKPIPPPTPAEISLDAAMKTINPAFTALRAAATNSKTDTIAENAAALKPAFTQAETIWDNLGQSAPAEWAREAREYTEALETAAAAGNWGAAKLAAGQINQMCTNCHAAYRERQDDGTFRITPGSF